MWLFSSTAFFLIIITVQSNYETHSSFRRRVVTLLSTLWVRSMMRCWCMVIEGARALQWTLLDGIWGATTLLLLLVRANFLSLTQLILLLLWIVGLLRAGSLLVERDCDRIDWVLIVDEVALVMLVHWRDVSLCGNARCLTIGFENQCCPCDDSRTVGLCSRLLLILLRYLVLKKNGNSIAFSLPCQSSWLPWRVADYFQFPQAPSSWIDQCPQSMQLASCSDWGSCSCLLCPHYLAL